MSGLAIVLNRLQGNLPLRELVPSSKIYGVVVPQNVEPPFIVISQASGYDHVTLLGQGEYPRDRIQIESVGADYNQVFEIGNGVKNALRNIIKQRFTLLRVKDVDITYTGLDITDYTDNREMVSRIMDFHVRWRSL